MAGDVSYLPKINKPVSYLKENIASFISRAAGTNLSEIQGWLADEVAVDRFHSNIKKEQEVYTLLSPEKSKKIRNFFHSPKLLCPDGKTTSIEKLLETGGGGVLINGRLGQGKSILLKYLQFLELNTGKTLPIHLELRKIRDGHDLVESACNKINSQGLTCSNKLFRFLMNEGRVTLFLDGFDEISLELRDSFNSSLSELCTSYPKLKVIVTSRHNTEISRNSNFVAYNISLLKKEDLAPYVKKILSNDTLSRPILSKILESDDFDYSVLDTPLMITWFIVVYNKRIKIPKTKLGFYEDLFSAILSRHDGFKDAYNRASRTKLADDELKMVFCALCYMARRKQKRIFTDAEVADYIRQALNVSGYKGVKSEDYLYDLTHVTCLMKRDGLDYEFIHESIAQYFSAFFIKCQMEANAKEFYTKRIGNWEKFDGELSFLCVIDKIRYNQFFYIPSILRVMGREGRYIKRTAMQELYSSTFIITRESTSDKEFILNTIVIVPVSDDYVIKTIRNEGRGEDFEELPDLFVKNCFSNDARFISRLKDAYKSESAGRTGMFSYCGFADFLADIGELDNFLNFVQPKLQSIFHLELRNSQKLIESEEQKGSLFS